MLDLARLEELVREISADDSSITFFHPMMFESLEALDDEGGEGDIFVDDVLIRIAEALENNTHVKEVRLCFGRSRFVSGEAGAEAIGRALSRNRSVELLDVDLDLFSGGCYAPIFRGLQESSRLKTFELKRNHRRGPLTPLDFRTTANSLSQLLQGSNAIESLALGSDILDDNTAVDIVAPTLAKNQSIKDLGLTMTSTGLSEQGVNALCDAIGGRGTINLDTCWTPRLAGLIRSRKNISKLNVSDSHEDEDGSVEEDVLDFASSFQESALTRLMLSKVYLNPRALQALASALSTSNTLKNLFWLFQHFGAGGGKSFFGALKTSSIKRLRIMICSICDESAKELATFLGTNQSLEVVHLFGNDIGDVGATALARAISCRSTALKELQLRQNQVGDAGALSIARLLLGPNSTLEELDLGSNKFGAEACKAFAEGLNGNKSLRSLDLSCKCDADEEMFEAYLSLINALCDNRSLRSLTFPLLDGSFSAERTEVLNKAFVAALEQNHTLLFCTNNFQDHPLVAMNSKGVIKASTLKGAPFPTYLIEGLSDISIPKTMVRVNKVAKLDGMYSFMRQMHEVVTARIETKCAAKRKIGHS